MGLAVEGADRGGAGLVVVVVQRLLDVREAAVAHEARRRHRPEQQQPCEWAGAGAGARACENGDEHNACVSWRRMQRLRACDGTNGLRHARTPARKDNGLCIRAVRTEQIELLPSGEQRAAALLRQQTQQRLVLQPPQRLWYHGPTPRNTGEFGGA